MLHGHIAEIAETALAIKVIQPQDAATSAITTSAIDTSGYQSVEFWITAGAITGTIDAKVQSSATSGGTYADISGAATTQWAATDDNHTKVIAVQRPTNRYLKLVVTPTGGTTNLVDAIVFLYGLTGLLPVTLDSTISQLVKVQVN